MSQYFDVFNGDADGIIALHQLRLAEERDAELITGTKRDIKLLQNIDQKQQSDITVLDISMESNADAMQHLLQNGHRLLWFDHHRSGDIPDHDNLNAHINLSPDICTSLLVDTYLSGAYHNWAIAATFGDNLRHVALKMCKHLSPSELKTLEAIGTGVNYNAYGEKPEDLNVWPSDLYLDMHRYKCPFDYFKQSKVLAKVLKQKEMDEEEMKTSEVLYSSSAGKCILLPDTQASKRMSGIYSNDLVYDEPDLAHAIFTRLHQQAAYRISIRAPLKNACGADELATLFPGGGGRPKAAGINELPEQELENFFHAFDQTYS